MMAVELYVFSFSFLNKYIHTYQPLFAKSKFLPGDGMLVQSAVTILYQIRTIVLWASLVYILKPDFSMPPTSRLYCFNMYDAFQREFHTWNVTPIRNQTHSWPHSYTNRREVVILALTAMTAFCIIYWRYFPDWKLPPLQLSHSTIRQAPIIFHLW